MGGSGSGNRWGARATTGDMHNVDIRWLHRNGRLERQGYFNMCWSRGEEKTGNINLRIYDNAVDLIYSFKDDSGAWQSVEERVSLTWTHPNYGGRRAWFLCPRCNRRVAVLYGGRYFRCRHCHDLAYQSQNESDADRFYRKAMKYRRLIGVSNDMPILFKPKGMHQKTFDRIRMKAEHFSIRADEAMLSWMAKIMKMGTKHIW